ncbi:hypothetical protein [Streptomyces sp. NPDC005498]|uniref:hypothetical protein n=1 Tax=Streptomyces sp. NPDC005498 TaxID=3364717 RepID=UPI0036986470
MALPLPTQPLITARPATAAWEARLWSAKSAEHVISALRKRLAVGRSPIPGILRDDGIPEPVGNTLNHNLIQALLKSAALMPNHLHLLGDDD